MKILNYIETKFGYGFFCVLICLLSFIASFLVSIKYSYFEIFSSILLGGVIGGLTNTIAIKMMFRKYRLLPGSGVLLKKKEEIVENLATTVEDYIFNPKMIEEKLQTAIEKINSDKIENTLNAFIDEYRNDLLKYINSDKTRNQLVSILKEKLGFTGKIVNITGIKDYDVMAHDILDNLDYEIEKFKITNEMVELVIEKTGDLNQLLFEPNNPLIIKHYNTSDSLSELLFKKFDVKKIVIEKLTEYPAEKIRDIIEENVKKHLAWLEIFGVLLGCICSALFLFFNSII